MMPYSYNHILDLGLICDIFIFMTPRIRNTILFLFLFVFFYRFLPSSNISSFHLTLHYVELSSQFYLFIDATSSRMKKTSLSALHAPLKTTVPDPESRIQDPRGV